jgi:hypothetical protein
VERRNLTIRTFMERFTSLSPGFANKLADVRDAVTPDTAYDNSCWRRGKLRVTAAMAAKVTHRLWSFDGLLAA